MPCGSQDSPAPWTSTGSTPLVNGAAGDRVRWVQRRLGIPQSGAFDAAMERALRAFQNMKGIHVDGVVNPHTFAYLSRSIPNSV